MNKVKQTEKVLKWFEHHDELTTRQAVIDLNIMSLPRRVMELRRSGYNITLEYRTSRTGARYGVYKLEEVPECIN